MLTCPFPFLASSEWQDRLTGAAVGGGEFAAAVQRAVPRGFGFRGFPVQFNHASPARMMAALLAAPVAREILHVRILTRCMQRISRSCVPPIPSSAAQMRSEPGTAFCLRCKVFLYAEDTAAVWVMLAARHRFS